MWEGGCRVTTSVVQGQRSQSVSLQLQGWLWPLGCSVWFCWFGSWCNSRITPCANSPDCGLLNAGHCMCCSLWVGVVGLPPGGAKTNQPGSMTENWGPRSSPASPPPSLPVSPRQPVPPIPLPLPRVANYLGFSTKALCPKR